MNKYLTKFGDIEFFSKSSHYICSKTSNEQMYGPSKGDKYIFINTMLVLQSKTNDLFYVKDCSCFFYLNKMHNTTNME